MRILSVFCILFLQLVLSCQSKNEINISGEVHNPGNVQVVTFYEGDRKLDSLFLSDRNTFKFSRESDQPRLLSVKIGRNTYPVILEPGRQLRLSTDLQQPEDYTIEGSDLSLSLKEIATEKNKINFVQDSLQKVFSSQLDNKSANEIQNLRSEMLAKFEPYMREYIDHAVSFAFKHKDLAGFYAMNSLDREFAEAELIAYADEIEDKFNENRSVNEFKEEVAKLKRLAVGQPAPEFSSFTPTNKAVNLSDYKGKYVLVDFWASWCMPCREENPNIVKQYHAFKAKGFDVLGVSLDDNPGPWMQAIKDDQLTWTNVSDLKAWSSDLIIKYSVKAIPTSYILDPDGKIIAKNLRGKELEDFLSKTLN